MLQAPVTMEDKETQFEELEDTFEQDGYTCKFLGTVVMKPSGKEEAQVRKKTTDEHGFIKIKHGITLGSGA